MGLKLKQLPSLSRTALETRYVDFSLVNPRGSFPDCYRVELAFRRWNTLFVQDMKMLFSSRDRAPIEQVRAKLVSAGVRCEVRDYPIDVQVSGTCSYPELWVQSNPDCQSASILFTSPGRLLRQSASDKGTAWSASLLNEL